jgi:hypothetical protein
MSDSADNFFEGDQEVEQQFASDEPNKTETNGEALNEEAAMGEDTDLSELKQRVKGMDEEAARLIQLQSEMEQQMKSTQSPTSSKYTTDLLPPISDCP